MPRTEAARGYVGVPSPNQAAVDASEKPITGALNNQAAAAATTQTSNAAAISADQQAQYDVDRSAYVDALVKHDAAVDRTDARYARQQRAYADAMAVWRVQVSECKKGKQKACRCHPLTSPIIIEVGRGGARSPLSAVSPSAARTIRSHIAASPAAAIASSGSRRVLSTAMASST